MQRSRSTNTRQKLERDKNLVDGSELGNVNEVMEDAANRAVCRVAHWLHEGGKAMTRGTVWHIGQNME